MFLSVEKVLLANDYYAIKNYDNVTLYQNLKDAKAQVGIIFHKKKNHWSFSFPLKGSYYNYITHFKEPYQIKQYALGRVYEL